MPWQGDPMQYSVHREEAIDALIEAMDHNSRKKVQESCSRALCILCCRFSQTGEASVEDWLLRKSGFNRTTDKIAAQVFSAFIVSPVMNQELNQQTKNTRTKKRRLQWKTGEEDSTASSFEAAARDSLHPSPIV